MSDWADGSNIPTVFPLQRRVSDEEVHEILKRPVTLMNPSVLRHLANDLIDARVAMKALRVLSEKRRLWIADYCTGLEDGWFCMECDEITVDRSGGVNHKSDCSVPSLVEEEGW